MKRAEEIMVPLRRVVVLAPHQSLRAAARKLSRAGVSGAPVVVGPKRKVVGVVSESDILQFVERAEADYGEKEMVDLEYALPTRVKQIMSKSVASVGPEAELDDVVGLMTKRKVNRVIVVDKKGFLRGLIARDDVLRAAFE